jgi:hypothetical protein
VFRTLARALVLVALSGTGACVSAGHGSGLSTLALAAAVEPYATPASDSIITGGPLCSECTSVARLPADVTNAVESRLADLKQRGGVCSQYGDVLEKSYRSGRITIRPYMWRVGDRLTSGEAQPNGTMTLAREIDPLNVGVRTVDDLVWSMEHEAVHIAFNITTGVEAGEDRANPYVRACRSMTRSAEPGSR